MDNSQRKTAIEAFLADHPSVERIEILLSDHNGVARGKWLPVSSAAKLWSDGLRFPVSSLALNIWGEDVDETGLGIESGDKDGIAYADVSTLSVVPWNDKAAQVIVEVTDPQGGDSDYDSRAILKRVLARFQARGLTPVVATELEFYVHQPRADEFERPKPPKFGSESHLLDYVQLDANEGFLTGVTQACKAQNIPADVVMAECGRGQFEINFKHTDNTLAAADHAVLFKRLVRGVARQHGLEATFMAKPFQDEAGSGCHVHISLLNAAGENVFSSDAGLTQTLQHALGGMLSTMPDAQAIFAPHFNSFRRYDREWFAPVEVNWGMDNRAAAVRIPTSQGPAARIEHRLAGADINPYLALAAILGGMIWGIEQDIAPCASLEDDATAVMGHLTFTWDGVIDVWETSDFVKVVLGAEFARVYGVVKRYEAAQFAAMITDVEYKIYLGRI